MMRGHKIYIHGMVNQLCSVYHLRFSDPFFIIFSKLFLNTKKKESSPVYSVNHGILNPVLKMNGDTKGAGVKSQTLLNSLLFLPPML